MAKHPLYNETGLIKNNKPHVLYALVDKRAELDGLRIETENKLAQLEYEVEILDNAIKIFDPELDITIAPKKPKDNDPDAISVKIVRDIIIKLLKSSDEPIGRMFIHEKVANLMNLDLNSGAVRRKLKAANSHVLARLCKTGLVEQKKYGKRHQALYSLKKIN